MRIDKACRVRDLAQEVVQLIDAAAARAHRDREATNEHRALVAYLDAHTQPPQPQPGERWLLGMDLGSVEQPVEVVEIGGERYFVLPCGTTPTLVHVADRDPSTYRRAES